MHSSYNLQKGVYLSHNFSEEIKEEKGDSLKSVQLVLWVLRIWFLSAGLCVCWFQKKISVQRFFLSSGAFSDPTNIFPSYMEFLVFICASLIHSVFTSCKSSTEVIRYVSSVSFMCSSAGKNREKLWLVLQTQAFHSIL